MSADTSPAASALRAARAGDWAGAQAILTQLITHVFSLRVVSLEISRDRYSLNSLNGFVKIAADQTQARDRDYFFKFHHEEGEEVTLQEFYRGEILKEAGFPVDMPAYVSKAVGSQLLLYVRRTSPRLADVCHALDDAPIADADRLLRAQSDFDAKSFDIYDRTCHAALPEQVARDPIHQLFHHRLVDAGRPLEAGGRARRFFWDRHFDLGGTVLSAAALRSARVIINGTPYDDTLDTLFARSRALLEPAGLARFGAVTAHGDAHNANLWWEDHPPESPRMVFFDPAFAGNHVSSLLAEVKATFHNIFAHPLWLYDAKQATARYEVIVRYDGACLDITSSWRLSEFRQRMLALKADKLWRPLLAGLHTRGFLPGDWRPTLRCALFCCPTLVMDLCAGGAGGHTPTSSVLGLAMAIAVGSEPSTGHEDVVSRFLDEIDPARA